MNIKLYGIRITCLLKSDRQFESDGRSRVAFQWNRVFYVLQKKNESYVMKKCNIQATRLVVGEVSKTGVKLELK